MTKAPQICGASLLQDVGDSYRYAIRIPVSVLIETIVPLRTPRVNVPEIFNPSSRRSSERVAPVSFASSGSFGRARNAVEGVRPFRPAIRYGRSSLLRLPELARRLGELFRNEAGTCCCSVAMAPSRSANYWRGLSVVYVSLDGPGFSKVVFFCCYWCVSSRCWRGVSAFRAASSM